ncbi:DUF1559 domain-containing protein [bacterium]|nr:MAG: DUF1559 domain-containing protein [bacterium]
MPKRVAHHMMPAMSARRCRTIGKLCLYKRQGNPKSPYSCTATGCNNQPTSSITFGGKDKNGCGNSKYLDGLRGIFVTVRRYKPSLVSKSGFTLIELLVVIAIIAILAAILFPVFARARENARKSSCMSNLKQIGIGVMQYTQDYDEKFPTWNGSNGITSVGWAGSLQPYLKSVQIFQCPSETVGPDSNPESGGYSDYAYNVWLGYDGANSNGRSLSYLTQASLSVMVYDSRGGPAERGTGRAYEDGGPFGTGTGNSAHLASFSDPSGLRHMDGINYAFCDGHVKWYKSVNSTTSSAVYSYCTPSTLGGTVGAGCLTNSTLVSGSSPTFNLNP